MSSQYLIFTVLCSVAILSAIVLAGDSSSSEESNSGEKNIHPYNGPPPHQHHHHDPRYHHHPRFHNHHHHHHPHGPHFRHNHHHHHHGPNDNFETTTTTASPHTFEGNDHGIELQTENIPTTTIAPPFTEFGTDDDQPNEGIDLRATKTTAVPDQQTDVSVTNTVQEAPSNTGSATNSDIENIFSGGLGVSQTETTSDQNILTTTGQHQPSTNTNSGSEDFDSLLSEALGLAKNQGGTATQENHPTTTDSTINNFFDELNS